MAERIVFWVFAVIGVGAGIAVISMRNVVHAALMLVVNLVSIAVLFLALQSPFLGVVQVIVYAGAIMVLFLFVIMLLGVDRDDLLVETRTSHRVGAALAASLVAGGALFAFSGGMSAAADCGPDAQQQPAAAQALRCRGLDQPLEAAGGSSVQLLADRLFSRYTFPLEAAALLLTVATIGAIVLGRRREDAESEPPPDLARSQGGASQPGGPAEGELMEGEHRGVSPPLGEERGGSHQPEPPMEGGNR